MNNIFKKGFYILAALVLSLATSCNDDDVEITKISGLDFVIATLNLEGTEIGVVPTTVNSNNRIVYSVDFGATPDVATDNVATSGPMVTFEYPNVDGTYTITVTASLQGATDVSISKDVTITEYVAPTIPTGPTSPLAGTWRMSQEEGTWGVGPEKGNVAWFNNDADVIAARGCFFDDDYIFNEDGSFQNVLGSETWIDPWQNPSLTASECGAPVFPHDGSNTEATWEYNAAAGTITLDGKGAYLGIPGANNGGEISSPGAAADSIVYEAVIDGNTLTLDIEVQDGGYWRFVLLKDAPPTFVGTWRMSQEEGTWGVGPEKGNVAWFNNDADVIAARGCFFDDDYIFNEDGSFQNVLGSETWIDPWQNPSLTASECGAPVFPHDGSNTEATWEYNAAAGTITLDGKGAYLGIPGANNGGEISSPGAAADSIVYEAVLDGDTLTLDIEVQDGGYWRFVLVKQ